MPQDVGALPTGIVAVGVIAHHRRSRFHDIALPDGRTRIDAILRLIHRRRHIPRPGNDIVIPERGIFPAGHFIFKAHRRRIVRIVLLITRVITIIGIKRPAGLIPGTDGDIVRRRRFIIASGIRPADGIPITQCRRVIVPRNIVRTESIRTQSFLIFCIIGAIVIRSRRLHDVIRTNGCRIRRDMTAIIAALRSQTDCITVPKRTRI